MKEAINRKYLLLGIIVILVILSYLIIKPFLIALISSFILAYLILPLHNIIKKKVNTHISAAICIILLILIIIIPIAIVTSQLIIQAEKSLSLNSLDVLLEKASNNQIIQKVGLNLEAIKSDVTSIIIELIKNTASNLPSIVFSILILILSTYYILINWDSISRKLKEYIPFKNKNKIAKEISESTHHIVYGYILIAIIEFIIASTGFYISGVHFYFLFPFLIALFALIPGVGPGLVWVPLMIYNIVIQDYGTAIGVAITGLIISILIETFLFAKIIGRKAKIHPLVLILGVLGGVSVFGIFGFIIGPLILAYTIKIINQGIEENKSKK